MATPTTTSVKRDGPYLGRVRVVDGLRNGLDVSTTGDLFVKVRNSAGVSLRLSTTGDQFTILTDRAGNEPTISTTGAQLVTIGDSTGATAQISTTGNQYVTVQDSAGSSMAISTTGILLTQSVTKVGTKTFPDTSTRAWVTATTAGNFVLASTVAAKKLNIVSMVVTSTNSASAKGSRFRISSSATTISPFIRIAPGGSLVLPPDPINGIPWFQSTAGQDLEIEVPTAVTGMTSSQLAFHAVVTQT